MDSKIAGKVMELSLAVLNEKLAEFGLVVSQSGRGTFSDTNLTVKLQFAEKSKTGEVMSREAAAFQKYAHAYNLKADDIFKPFAYAGKTYKVIGLEPRRVKFPILCEDEKGVKRLLLEGSVVKALHPETFEKLKIGISGYGVTR